MTTREQLLFEEVRALEDLLKEFSNVPDEAIDDVRNANELGEAPAIAEQMRGNSN